MDEEKENDTSVMDLWDFLRSRDFSEEVISHLKEEKIDCEVLGQLDIEELHNIFPKYGDRIAILNFCKQESRNQKQSLIQRIKEKLEMGTTKKRKTNNMKIKSSSASKKNTRFIEVGWMCYDKKLMEYKYRKISVEKETKCTEILNKAKELFFPRGISSKGHAQHFHFDLLDFKRHKFDLALNVQEMYSITAMSSLRFYLATILKEGIELADNDEHYIPATVTNPGEERPLTYNLCSSSTATAQTTNGPESTMTSGAYNTQITNELLNVDSIPTIHVAETGNLYDETVHNIFLDEILLENKENEEIFTFKIVLHRGQVLKELLNVFETVDVSRIKNLHINIEMFMPNGKKEAAFDVGGVFRDALSEFWSTFYDSCTNGTSYKVPLIREDYNCDKWKAVAKIIYVGYKHVNYFPIKLALVFMETCIYGEIKSDLLHSFLDIMSLPDKDIIKNDLNNFDDADIEEIVEVCSIFDCKRFPNKNNFQDIVCHLAHKELIQKPKYIIDCWTPILKGFIDDEYFVDIHGGPF